MEKKEEMKLTLNELASIGEKMEEVAEVEATFSERLDALNAKLESITAISRGLEDTIRLFDNELKKLEELTSLLPELEKRLSETEEKLGSLDLAKLTDATLSATDAIEKCLKKAAKAEETAKEKKTPLNKKKR